MTAQANIQVVPQENQHSSTMASHLRDFRMMNTSMFFRSMVDEDPEDFLDGVYKIEFSIGVITTNKGYACCLLTQGRG